MSNLRPSDDFQFSGYNEGYEEEFREIGKRHLWRKSISKSEILEENLFFREHLNFGTKSKKLYQENRERPFFLETFLKRKSRNQNKFAYEQISAHTHTAKN